jgi:hypothetical protein
MIPLIISRVAALLSKLPPPEQTAHSRARAFSSDVSTAATPAALTTSGASIEAADTQKHNLIKQNERPQEPEPDECCSNDCRDCVWVEYTSKLDAWRSRDGVSDPALKKGASGES